MGFSHSHSASGLGAAADNSESISRLSVPQAGEELFALKLVGTSPEILENQKRIADPENVLCESPNLDLMDALFRNSRLHRIDLAGFLPCEQNGCQRQDEINESSRSSHAPSINSIRAFLGSMHAPQGAACNGFQWNIITENPPAGDDPGIEVVIRTLMQCNERSAGGNHALYPDLGWKAQPSLLGNRIPSIKPKTDTPLEIC